jgi:hypothetical protein
MNLNPPVIFVHFPCIEGKTDLEQLLDQVANNLPKITGDLETHRDMPEALE